MYTYVYICMYTGDTVAGVAAMHGILLAELERLNLKTGNRASIEPE